MLSRVADSVFWINRNMERVENYARFISVNINLALDLPPTVEEQWEPLIVATADDDIFKKYYDKPTRENVIDFLTFDMRNPNSILSNLYSIRENARTIRETITREMWEHINGLYHEVNAAAQAKNNTLNNIQDFFTDIKMGSQLFFGIEDASLTRDEIWHFANMGRYIERADKTARILDVKYFILLPDIKKVGSPLDLVQWTAVLKSASAYNMYRQQYREIMPSHISEFLILDRKFPRSVLFSLRMVENSLRAVSGTPLGSFKNEAEKKLGRMRADLEFMDIQDIMNIGLHEFLDEIQLKCNEISHEIHEAFFAIKPV
jgi:uncharacterized alpha-E superfamily protein